MNESEIIDNSFELSVEKDSKRYTDNNTLIVPESEEDSEYSEDESNEQSSTSKQEILVLNKDSIVVSDSDSSEDAASPELLPKRRPKINYSNKSEDSPIIKGKKRIMRIDSDTDNSLILEQNNHNKLMCVKETPEFLQYSDSCDEVERAISKTTRRSIMGIMPKIVGDSDESDKTFSDKSNLPSRSSSHSNLNDLPLIELTHTRHHDLTDSKTQDSIKHNKSLESPLKDITNRIKNETTNLEKDITNDLNPKMRVDENLKNKVLKKLMDSEQENANGSFGVAVVENPPEIITLSSDDEESTENSLQNQKSPISPPSSISKTSHSSQQPSGDIKQYLVPASYPNAGVKYVPQKVRDEALKELNILREEKANMEAAMKRTNIQALPDNGMKIVKRLSLLTEKLRLKEELVSNMVAIPADEKKKSNVLSWEEIQKGSNAVQPVGNQCFSTHMVERGLIMERLRQLHASLDSRPDATAVAVAPRGLATALMPHQLTALAWLRWREAQSPPAGLLADDMGLGKTLTMIALVLSDKESAIDNDVDESEEEGSKLSRGGTLVVCPASLAQQWAGEVKRHCRAGALGVCLHHGAARATSHHRLLAHDMVVTTYNILQRDHEKSGVLMRVAWRRVILDEAHAVRNHKTATCAAACAVRARRRWCLTGTPVHNKDLDMFSLLKFMRLTPFNDIKMWKKWIDNKNVGGQLRLSTITRCLVLRRTKAQLLSDGELQGLPDRELYYRWFTLNEAELNVYQKVLTFSKNLFNKFLMQRAESQADGGRDNAYEEMHKRMIAFKGVKVKSHQILVLLLRLRQICCHCGLIGAMLSDEDQDEVEEDEGSQVLLDALKKLSIEPRFTGNNDEDDEEDEGNDQEGKTVSEALRSVMSSSNPVFNLEKPSSKIKAVMDCLQNDVLVNQGDKAVVVSQWTSVLHLIKRELDARSVPVALFTGRVAVDQRAKIVAQFNDPRSEYKVMLLSLCAGGVGLNLCGANHLLLVDPHWNPQLEQQAQDRVYRVGQHKPVHIYKFLCSETVEQNIKKLQDTKLEMAENVLTGAKNASKLTINDLKMLFHMTEYRDNGVTILEDRV